MKENNKKVSNEFSKQTKLVEQTEQHSEKFLNILENNQNVVHQGQLYALAEMSKGISHEVNNPLAIIKGHLNKIERNISTCECENCDSLLSFEKIHEMIERISHITNNLKYFSRDYSNCTKMPTSISRILDATDSLCRSQLFDHGIKLETNISEKSLSIPCNGPQISQVLFHMLINSKDSIKNLPERWIKIDVKKVDSLLQISITDSGKGIPAEIQDRVFWPFFTTKEQGKGTGLGLSSSSGIISQHSGTIKIDTHSKNTKFIITLPLN